MSSYLLFQLLLVLLWAASHLALLAPISRRSALRMVRVLALGALLAPAFVAGVPDALWRPAPQVFTALALDGSATLGLDRGAPLLRLPAASAPLGRALGLGFVLAALLWATRSALALRRALAETTPLRRLRGTEIRVGSQSFAAWRPGQRLVVLDEALLARPQDWRCALAHELQHHRQGDLLWAWGLLVLRAACAWNPFAHAFVRQLAALEELACDEAVLARGRISARAYGGCLLRATGPAPFPLAIGLHHPSLLHRRIQMLTSPPRPRRLLALPLTAALLAALLGTAWGASSLVTSQAPLSEAAFAEVTRAASSPEFTLPANAGLAEALDGIRSRPKTATFFAEGLAQRGEWQELVDGALRAHGLPPQLAAVPLVESGYRNLGAYAEGLSAAPGVPGKGLWMFIPSTAREYGLRVDEEADERLDPKRETEAAMQLLSDLYAEFGDWGLALAGYNQGAAAVRTAIETEGTRDVWTLCARGALNHYVPMVMAASLLLNDPSLLPR